MRGYTQLAQEQRYQIYALMKAGHNQTKIAGIVVKKGTEGFLIEGFLVNQLAAVLKIKSLRPL